MTTPAINAGAAAFARVGLTPAECPLARARQRGWNDWLAGKPFRRTYDLWKRRKQFAYERGRIQAATAAFSATSKLTRWGENELLLPVLFRSLRPDVAIRVYEETKVARKARRSRKGIV